MTPVESKEKCRAGKWELFRGRPNGPERGSSKKIKINQGKGKKEKKKKIKGKKSRERKRKRKKKKEQGSAVATKGGTGS